MERKEVKEKHRERYGKKVKKMFLVKFQANRMGKEVKEIQKKQNKGVKSGRGVAENIWRGNRQKEAEKGENRNRGMKQNKEIKWGDESE